ncbi:hypothetical protein CJU89_4257 [Yarrowia sp. B02]|nr:hypothetical protein CJU89_4257 [Yarrowia sp. B02]
MNVIPITELSPTEQLLALIPKLFEGNGNLASLTALLPFGILSTVLNSPYGPALVDIISSQDTLPLEYDDRLLTLFPIPRFAKTGTGVVKVVGMAHELAGNNIPQYVLDMVMTTQYNIYGNFAKKEVDTIPSAIFLVINSILAVANFYVFFRGILRKHNFYLTFGLGWQCLFNCLGFGMRLGWAQDVLQLRLGIASTVFIILSIVTINFMNFLLAHRILTFRHPETGDATWFALFMILIYLAFCGVLLMAILTQLVIFSYFLDYMHWRQATSGMQAASILIVLFSIGGVFIIIVAYLIPRGAIPLHHKSRLRLTASNIESYGLFYFPPKHSQVIQYKSDPSQKLESGQLAARTINGNDLHTSAIVVIFTSLILAGTAAMRCATVMIGDRWMKDSKFIYSQTAFYIGFGAFEVIVNVIFLLFRIDLRFYIPDWPKKGQGALVVNRHTGEYLKEDDLVDRADRRDFVFVNVPKPPPTQDWTPPDDSNTYGDLKGEERSFDFDDKEKLAFVEVKSVPSDDIEVPQTPMMPDKTYLSLTSKTPQSIVPAYASPATYANTNGINGMNGKGIDSVIVTVKEAANDIPGNPPTLAAAARPTVISPSPSASMPATPTLPVLLEASEARSSRSYSPKSPEVLAMPSPHFSDYSYYARPYEERRSDLYDV